MTELSQKLIVSLSSLFALMSVTLARASELAEGMPAPAFELKDQDGKLHRLADYRGRWVVIYFYPKDDTPGCTTEACNFRDDLPKLRELGVQIFGLSTDNIASHAKFATKFKLPFPLLADEGGTVAKSYGSLWSLGPVKFTKRHSFIVDPEGKIARIYRDVKPERHSREIQEDLRMLRSVKN